jgi:hypothetical protein
MQANVNQMAMDRKYAELKKRFRSKRDLYNYITTRMVSTQPTVNEIEHNFRLLARLLTISWLHLRTPILKV